MEVLKKIMEGSLSNSQRDRSYALLKSKYPPYSVERNRLNNADKYFGERVFNLEKAQAQAYNSSQMPPDLETKGKLYKAQSYANPLMGSLRGKLQLAEQLTAQVEFARAETARGKQTSAGAVILTPDLLKNNYFGTKEVVNEFNEFQNYLKNYGGALTSTDQENLDQLFQGILVPILQQLQQVWTTYANFWNTLPNFNNRPQEIIKDAVKKLVKKCWTIYNVMFQLLSTFQFRPMTADDIELYQRDNPVDADILAGFPSKMPQPNLPIPLPPTQQPTVQPVPAPVPAPIPQPPIPRVSNIKMPSDTFIATLPQAPAGAVDTSGAVVSQKNYFFLLAYKWTINEEEFLVRQQIPRYEQGIAQDKQTLQRLTTDLNAIQQAGRGDPREAQLVQDIATLKTDIQANEAQLKELNKRKVKLFTAQELIVEYLREVAKIPTNAEGNITDRYMAQIPNRDLRAFQGRNEDILKDAVGLVGYGMSGGQYLSREEDHDDHIPIHTSEFEMKRRMSDRARGDKRVVLQDQLIPYRQLIFPDEAEFNPKFELLKRGYKANDTVMEPDRDMKSAVVPIESGPYLASGIIDNENETAFKQRFGLPYSQHARRTDDRPIVAEHKRPFGGFFDIDGNDEFNTVKQYEELFKPVEHFKVEEEPDDILEHPDEFKKKIETYRFNTGRLKNKPSFMKS